MYSSPISSPQHARSRRFGLQVLSKKVFPKKKSEQKMLWKVCVYLCVCFCEQSASRNNHPNRSEQPITERSLIWTDVWFHFRPVLSRSARVLRQVQFNFSFCWSLQKVDFESLFEFSLIVNSEHIVGWIQHSRLKQPKFCPSVERPAWSRALIKRWIRLLVMQNQCVFGRMKSFELFTWPSKMLFFWIWKVRMCHRSETPKQFSVSLSLWLISRNYLKIT